MLKNFALESEARAHASQQADLLTVGNLAIAAMNPDDRQTYVAAMKILKPLGVLKFAQRRGYLPKNQRSEADDLELPD